MIDQKKIILMSKAALEKKKFSRKDREVTDYYIEDYVYISNFKTRIFVLMIIGGLIGGQMMLKIQTGLNIPTTVKEWLYEYIIPYGTIIVAFLVIYTFISTWIYTYKYNDAQKKKKNYERALTELKKYQE
ncbi:MAG: hypothetical protein RR618_04120 [Cellulosilyticaceae bacterium]